MAKTFTREEKRAASQLAKSQETSRRILASELAADGVPKAEINRIVKAEAVADKAEVLAYRTDAKAAGVQQYSGFQRRTLTAGEILAASPQARAAGLTEQDVQRLVSEGRIQQPTASTGYIAADLTTVSETYRDAAQSAMDRQMAGIQQLQELGLQQGFQKGKTGVGSNAMQAEILSRSRDPNTGAFMVTPELRALNASPRSANLAVEYFNIADRLSSDDSLTAEDIGKKLKPIKGTEDLFTSQLSSWEKGGLTGTFQRNEDGTYDYLGAARSMTPTDGGGFGSFIKSVGGSIALGALGSLVGLPTLGSLAGLSGTAAAAVNVGAALGAAGLSAYKNQAEYDAAVARGEIAGLDALFTDYFAQQQAAGDAGVGAVEARQGEITEQRNETLADLGRQNEEASRRFQESQAAAASAAASQQQELQRLQAENAAAAERNRMELEGAQRGSAARRASRRRAVSRGRGMLSGFSLNRPRSLGTSSALGGGTTLSGA